MDPAAERERLIATIPASLCVRCKGGRLLCGLARCPILDSIRDKMPEVPKVHGKEVQGSSPPTLFVGRYGYPTVRVGPMLPPLHRADAHELDDPRGWIGKKGLRDIVALRSSLFRSGSPVRVETPHLRDAPRNELLESAQLLAMASKPADVAVTLSKVPDARLQPKLDGISAPMGPSLEAEHAKVVDNPFVPRKVDALVGDVHAPANHAVQELYQGGVSAYHIQRLLSAGLLGMEHRRRLVPTRWSITATDDTLGKQLIARVKGMQQLGQVELFTSAHYGNHFWVLLLPRAWAFEMVEVWNAGSAWAREDAAGQDWEPYEGRTTYAENVGGAYYAARLSVLERLVQRQRQAQVLVYRQITDEYLFPLGVWVIRESVRLAMEAKPRAFDSLEAAVRMVGMESGKPAWPRWSTLLREARVQRRLEDFAVPARPT
ncbi:MAG: Nre family DNA repair protein [Halobacteriales archaeon]|nr:Nre family DNA repair protein [Halobacteriales archaeon]